MSPEVQIGKFMWFDTAKILGGVAVAIASVSLAGNLLMNQHGNNTFPNNLPESAEYRCTGVTTVDVKDGHALLVPQLAKIASGQAVRPVDVATQIGAVSKDGIYQGSQPLVPGSVGGIEVTPPRPNSGFRDFRVVAVVGSDTAYSLVACPLVTMGTTSKD